MLKKLFLPILFSAIIGSVVSCNSSSEDEETTYIESSSVEITSFYIKDNKKILDSLSNVFFSIDLVNAKIFNADSLPYGTKISRLQPSITAPSTASAVELRYYCPEVGRDSVVNYLTNSTDSIDFSAGPVKLTVVSQSGLVKREYEIRVNVHQVKADSLTWFSIQSAPLPTSFSTVKAQRTAQLDGKYYCLSTDGSKYCLATTTNPADPNWETREITLAFTPQVNTLRASSKALYMLSNDGELYTSADFTNWTSTSQRWHYIYGDYTDQIVGCTSDQSQIAMYPSGKTWSMPSGFPIDGTSTTSTYDLSMGYATQLVMIGGRLADGTLSSSAWGFDGQNWAKVSTLEIPDAMQDITLIPYKLVEIPNTTWSPYNYPVLFAMGGRDKTGAINRTVYYSRDWGMTWRKAPELVQLPEAVPTAYGYSAFVHTTLMHLSRSNGWAELPLRALPPQYSYMGLPISRGATLPTEWDCPAIYLFGGTDSQGSVQNTVWRGVIMQFTMQPIF